VPALVRDLSHPKFATRQRVTDALVRLGEFALPTLRKAQASGPDEETRRRLQQVVGRATSTGYRKLRAVAVLEEIADAAAVRVLKSLSRGQPESLQTVEAMVALRRLRK
jgi:hypothetical protein